MNRDSYEAVVSRLFPDSALRSASRLAGGVSADVYRLDVDRSDGGTQSVVLRVHGAAHHGHPADLEYRLLQALRRAGLPVPEPLFVDTSGALLKAPFLVTGFIEGTSEIPLAKAEQRIASMAELLAQIHRLPTGPLPALPERLDPLPEVFDFLPHGNEWSALRAHLRSLTDTAYRGPARLLHGDFWPKNLLWQDGRIAGVLDWEDAALGDPLSDVACSQVELRYQLGKPAMERFARAYALHQAIDTERLALWQVYVAAAAQHFMGSWGLAPTLESHMRAEALHSIRDAAAMLITANR